jgi:quinol monooxygenase YgiN
VSVVETMTFRLRPEADEATFRAADAAVQTDFAYQQPGLLRRTTARSADGTWLVIDQWTDDAAADAMAPHWNADPVAARFMSCVDEGSVEIARYHTLD